jgi:hypothetical protein
MCTVIRGTRGKVCVQGIELTSSSVGHPCADLLLGNATLLRQLTFNFGAGVRVVLMGIKPRLELVQGLEREFGIAACSRSPNLVVGRR